MFKLVLTVCLYFLCTVSICISINMQVKLCEHTRLINSDLYTVVETQMHSFHSSGNKNAFKINNINPVALIVYNVLIGQD